MNTQLHNYRLVFRGRSFLVIASTYATAQRAILQYMDLWYMSARLNKYWTDQIEPVPADDGRAADKVLAAN